MNIENNNILIENISPVQKKITVKIPKEKVKKEIDLGYKKLNKSVFIKGFRPGKVPKFILEQYYKNQLEREISEDLINNSFKELIEKEIISPVSRPIIEDGKIKEGEDLTYTATFDVLPEFEINKYTEFEIERELHEFDEEDVNNELKKISKMYATLAPIDTRPIKSGDYVIISLKVYIEEEIPQEDINIITIDNRIRTKKVELKKYSKDELIINIGSLTSEIPELEEKLEGLSVNEEKEIVIEFPKDHKNKDFAGNTIYFLVKVKEIKEVVLPPLDDNFAKDLGYENLELLINKIKEALVKNDEQNANKKVDEKILDILVEKNPIELPPSWVNNNIEKTIKELQHELAHKGLNNLEINNKINLLKPSIEKNAKREVAISILLKKISEIEKIDVEEEEIDEYLKNLAASMNKPFEDVKAYYQKDDLIEELKYRLKEEKTMKFLRSKSIIKDVIHYKNKEKVN